MPPPNPDRTHPARKGARASGPELAQVFFALGDATRLRLIAVLCAGGAFSIAQLTANTDITRQAVTKHLRVLADAGLVWQFDPTQLEEARRSLEVIGRQWEQALGKLKAFVEADR
jgi:predicted transcriptional regulator